MKLYERDSHCHSPFCPHRHSPDGFEGYVAAAEAAGLKELCFTEHILPCAISELQWDKFITAEELKDYLKELKAFRQSYKGPVSIKIGFEFDYMEGKEYELKELLNEFGPQTEENLLSVHHLRVGDIYLYLSLERMIPAAAEALGGEFELSRLYYRTQEMMIKADLGPYKPRKIAHPTLIRLDWMNHPGFFNDPDTLDHFARMAKEGGFALEFNTQGLIKNSCQEVFGEPLLPYIRQYDIPVFLGSDAHEPKYIADGFRRPVFDKNMDWMRPDWEV